MDERYAGKATTIRDSMIERRVFISAAGSEQVTRATPHDGDTMQASSRKLLADIAVQLQVDLAWCSRRSLLSGTTTIAREVVYGDFDHDGAVNIATAGKLGVRVSKV